MAPEDFEPESTAGPEIPPRPEASTAGRGRFAAAVGIVMVVGAIVRWLAAQGGLWLDEVWSVWLLQDVSSFWGVLDSIHHDNNHHLNSWYLMAIGLPQEYVVYRLLSLVAGVGCVVLGACAARGAERTERLLAAILVAGSYLLIHYSSEARGYAPMLFFALGAYLVVGRWLARPRAIWTVLFWFCVVLGFLSHLSFFHVYAGLAVWMAWGLLRREESLRTALLRFGGAHLAPVLFLVAFYWIDVRHLEVGGGPEYQVAEVLERTFSYAVGGPVEGAGAWIAAGLAVVAYVAGLAVLVRAGRREWTFFLVAVFVSPAAVLLLAAPEVLFVRYFLVSVTFGLLLVAAVLARLWRMGRGGALAAAAIAATILLGNAVHTVHLLRTGRGAFHDALQNALVRDPEPAITLTGTNQELDHWMLWFYHHHLPPGRDLRYLLPGDGTTRPPNWLFLSSFEGGFDAPGSAELAGGRYDLVGSFLSPPMSGGDWFIYRRAGPDATVEGGR